MVNLELVRNGTPPDPFTAEGIRRYDDEALRKLHDLAAGELRRRWRLRGDMMQIREAGAERARGNRTRRVANG